MARVDPRSNAPPESGHRCSAPVRARGGLRQHRGTHRGDHANDPGYLRHDAHARGPGRRSGGARTGARAYPDAKRALSKSARNAGRRRADGTSLLQAGFRFRARRRWLRGRIAVVSLRSSDRGRSDRRGGTDRGLRDHSRAPADGAGADDFASGSDAGTARAAPPDGGGGLPGADQLLLR